MLNYASIERNKSKIVNFVVIILALIIAFQFFKSANDQVAALIQQQNNELEKNKIIQDISALEKEAEIYKKVFVKKDLASIVDTISAIAKESSVKIISIKPYAEEILNQHTNSSFLVTLNTHGYHALGEFISRIENHKDFYLVTDVSINSTVLEPEALGAKVDLGVNLTINTVSYL